MINITNLQKGMQWVDIATVGTSLSKNLHPFTMLIPFGSLVWIKKKKRHSFCF